jgi:hypothetical protein
MEEYIKQVTHPMRIPFQILLLLLCCFACKNDSEEKSASTESEAPLEIPFDKAKWVEMEDEDYIFRAQMLNEVLYNDTIRTLKEAEIIALLGEPDRVNDGHLYYTVVQKRLGAWPLSTKSLVIKFKKDGTIEWIKTHG